MFWVCFYLPLPTFRNPWVSVSARYSRAQAEESAARAAATYGGLYGVAERLAPPDSLHYQRDREPGT